MCISDIYELYLSSNGITTDTRKITDNCIFLSLKGERFNGNKFAEKALKMGAAYAIVDEAEFDTHQNTILVDNALYTLQELATYHRRELGIEIISLTGSNGKTTTKELINIILSKKYNTTATIGNLNNHIGVPLTLLALSHTTEIGIVEMGANHLKEIELLATITQPDYGYITNFGKAHLEGFGGIEGVIQGKSELYTYLEKNHKKAFINTADPIQVEFSQQLDAIFFGEKTSIVKMDPFLVVKYAGLEIHTNLVGEYNLDNISAAIAIGEYFNIAAKDIKVALESYKPTNNRSQIIKKSNATIILDAYNANPTSMTAALSNFAKNPAKDKIIILGDMFELGATSEPEHQAILDLAESLGFQEIHLIGEHFFKTKASKSNLHSSFEAFKNSFHSYPSTYLIKGSRGMALERTLDLFD